MGSTPSPNPVHKVSMVLPPKEFLVCSDHPSGLLNQERARQEGTSLSFQLTGVFEESPYSQDSLVSFDLKIH